MAKFKPAGARKPSATEKRSKYNFIPCLVVVLLGLGMIFLLLNALLTSGK